MPENVADRKSLLGGLQMQPLTSSLPESLQQLNDGA